MKTGLVIRINGRRYRVERLETHPNVARIAYQLTKRNGHFHHVHVSRHGPECTCEDFIFRPKRFGCKHIKALKENDLL